MPNWCHNTLYVTGPNDQVREFAAAAKSDKQPLSFDRIVPLGEWDYDLAIERWGTKWDARFPDDGIVLALGGEDADLSASRPSTIIESDQKATAVYRFDTAWSPPIGVIERAAELYPTLRFSLTYGEPGNDFAGRIVYENGTMLADEELAVEEALAPSEMWF